MLSGLSITASQERCISEYFLEKVDSVFTCDFQGMKNVDKIDNEYNCVHFLGLPNMKVCGEVGLRFKRFPNAIVNSSISLRYSSNKNRKINYEIIEMDDKYGWNHWSKIICADFLNGVSINHIIILFDLPNIFINPPEIEPKKKIKFEHYRSTYTFHHQ